MVSETEIVVMGGSDPRGVLSRRAFLINTCSKSVSELPSLPRVAKEGHLLASDGFYYYIGNTAEAEDLDSPAPTEYSSIMRYDLQSHLWEIFSDISSEKSPISSGLNRKAIEEVKKSERKVLLKDLISTGAFTYNGRIYLVGGKICQDGIYSPSDKIFSVGIEDESFFLREETIKLPVKLVNPVCASGGSHAFIAGGCLENNQPSLRMFVIKFLKNEIHECHAKLDSAIEEKYPPAYLENEVVIFSFPKLWIKPKNEDKAVPFVFNKLSSGGGQIRESAIEESKNFKKDSEKNKELGSLQGGLSKNERSAGGKMGIEESKGKAKKSDKQKRLIVDSFDNSEKRREKKQAAVVAPIAHVEDSINISENSNE